jgi:chlorite dismutase
MSEDASAATWQPSGVPLFVQALALGLDPGWRRRPWDDRADDATRFAAGDAGADQLGVLSVSYSSIGLEPGVDVLFWRTAPAVDALEEAAALLLREGLGRWLSVTHSFLGRIGPSQYVRKPTAQEQSILAGPRARYLVVYPFTKSTEWYLTPSDERQQVMNEHMKVGHRYPTVRQALAYSFGLDSQDFVVAYETDDLAVFGDLVRELRGTESRLATVSDTPILLGVQRPIDEILRLLGAPAKAGAEARPDPRSPSGRERQ